MDYASAAPAVPRSLFKRVVVFMIGALLACLAMELVVRQAVTITYGYEPGFGYIRKSVLWRLEGNGFSRWTIWLVRRAARPDMSKPRLLVLGDSYTESFMVDDEDVYTERTERLLDSVRPGLQVLNAGAAGSSPADYLVHASSYKTLFSPRWTVIQLTAAALGADSWNPSRNHFVQAADGNVRAVKLVPTPFEQSQQGRLRQFQRRYFPSMLAYYGLVRRLPDFIEAEARQPPLFRAGARQALRDQEYPVERVLALLGNAYAGRVTFLYLPRFDPAHPAALEPVEARFQAFCTSNRLSCVSIRPFYPSFARANVAPFGFSNSRYNGGHMNALGHHAAGSALASELQRLAAHGLF